MNAYMDTIEQSIFIRLVLLEDPHVLEHLRIDFDLLEVSDRVFTQKVKAESIWRLQRDVFTTERATAHGIGLVFALLVTSSKSEDIDEVHSRGSLPIRHLLRLEFLSIIRPDSIDMVLRGGRVSGRSEVGRGHHVTFSSRAFSNLDISLCPLRELPAARKTYLWFWLMFSTQLASQVTVLSWITCFHVPSTLGSGMGSC